MKICVSLLLQLLYALELSGSLMLLEILISIMCKEAKHVHEDEIQSSISNFVARSVVVD